MAAFGKGSLNSVAGALSGSRTTSRSHAASAQSYIYNMRVRCVLTTVALHDFDELYWTDDFLKEMKALPREYSTGDDLEPYVNFWNTYGL